MESLLQKILDFTYNHFHKSTGKMLIYTGVIGWTLSSAAQIMAIALNPKLNNKKKSFLLPQEGADAATNIGLFFVITQVVKNITEKLFDTGKFTTKSAREFIKKNPELSEKIGHFDFNLTEALKNTKYERKHCACKNLVTTVATIGAGIISSSILTPIIRNKMASNVQKTYIDNKDYIDSEIKRKTEARMAKLYNKNKYSLYNNYSSGMKI